MMFLLLCIVRDIARFATQISKQTQCIGVRRLFNSLYWSMVKVS